MYSLTALSGQPLGRNMPRSVGNMSDVGFPFFVAKAPAGVSGFNEHNSAPLAVVLTLRYLETPDLRADIH